MDPFIDEFMVVAFITDELLFTITDALLMAAKDCSCLGDTARDELADSMTVAISEPRRAAADAAFVMECDASVKGACTEAEEKALVLAALAVDIDEEEEMEQEEDGGDDVDDKDDVDGVDFEGVATSEAAEVSAVTGLTLVTCQLLLVCVKS